MELEDVLAHLETAQTELDPQFKALRAVTGALKVATRLASAENADALPMQKSPSGSFIRRGIVFYNFYA